MVGGARSAKPLPSRTCLSSDPEERPRLPLQVVPERGRWVAGAWVGGRHPGLDVTGCGGGAELWGKAGSARSPESSSYGPVQSHL